MKNTWLHWVKTDRELNWFEKCLLLSVTPIAVLVMRFMDVKPINFESALESMETQQEERPAAFFKRPPMNLQIVDSKNSFKIGEL